MAMKLSFSVENILNGCTVSSTETGNKYVQQNRDRSLSDCSTPSSCGVERLTTPPCSPFSTASVPSPLTGSLIDEPSDSTGSHSNTVLEAMEDRDQSCSRKSRMRFSQDQIKTLEKRFQDQQYLLPADRKVLAVGLRMTERQVKTWFQNKRAQHKRSRSCSRLSPVIMPNPFPMYPRTQTAFTSLASSLSTYNLCRLRNSPVVMANPLLYPTPVQSPTLPLLPLFPRLLMDKQIRS